jgi:hypothetical protein
LRHVASPSGTLVLHNPADLREVLGWPRSCNPAGVSFGLYLFGIVLVIAGLIYGAVIVNIPTQWIVVLALLLLGGGIVTAVKSTRQRDPIE